MTLQCINGIIPLKGDNMAMKKIYLNGVETEYELTRKSVKNINLRIKPDGIYVSAGRWVSEKYIESFLLSKADFILKAKEKLKNNNAVSKKQYFTEDEIKDFILKKCKEIYPCYEKMGFSYPLIKFRKMTSMWGNCRAKSGILTFNTNLMYAPKECVEYVIYHEFTHFLVQNHSDKFYAELSKVYPNWKEAKKILKTIIIK